MKIGVPKETADGERRVALVPDVVKSLKKNENVDVVVESGAGDAAGHPDSQYTEAGAEVGEADVTWGADVVLRVAVPSAEEIGRLSSNQLLIAHLAPWTSAETNRALAAGGRHQLRDGGDPAHDPRPGDGRALLAGRRCGLRRDADRRPRVGPLLRDDDHRRRHGPAGQGARPRRRRRRPAGGRHRQAARRDRHRLRHPPRRLGADRLARRPTAGARLHPRRGGRGRLRAPAHRRGERAGARRARRERRQAGHHRHHRRDPRPPGAAADHRRRGARDGARLGDRRPRRRDRRQLRADRGGRDGGRERGQGDRPAQPGERDAGPGLAALREEPGEPARAAGHRGGRRSNVDFEDDIVAAACITQGGEIRNERAREVDDA